MKIRTLLILVILLGISAQPRLQGQNAAGISGPGVVTTFECAGICWKTSDEGACHVRYRQRSGSEWKTGMDLVYDNRDGEYRGSLVGLKPGTGYETELTAGRSKG